MQDSTYDVIVVGAGPAGAEASLAAAGGGARTLCLTISLDTAGFPPANPILADGFDDPRHILLAEIGDLGGALPFLLEEEGVSANAGGGVLLADRRQLGLSYKQALETGESLDFRQALVTSIRPQGKGWSVTTALEEEFHCRSIVLAAGTFCEGKVSVGGATRPGGRLGEIPAVALPRCLRDLGLEMVRIDAATSPRMPASLLVSGSGRKVCGFPVDGAQLDEVYGYGLEITGPAASQLDELRSRLRRDDAWISRPSFSVSHLCLAAGQVGPDLQSAAVSGLFAAGRFAGSCNYVEAAALGIIAGANAAGAGTAPPVPGNLISYPILVGNLCSRISTRRQRPVTIRTVGEGC